MMNSDFRKLKFHLVEVSTFKINNNNFVLAKPQTFMNLSGRVIPILKKKYMISDENIFVAVDNVDLEAGRLKLREGGSDAGHNGLKSISSFVSRSKYKKIYIGVSRSHPGLDLANYVLMEPTREEAAKIDGALDFLVKILKERSLEDLPALMNIINSYRE